MSTDKYQRLRAAIAAGEFTLIDLKQFCAKNDPRYYLLGPFVFEGHTYATDGHIMVRVPGGEPSPEQDVPNRTLRVIRDHFAAEFSDYQPLPEIPAPQPCPDCEGAGRIKTGRCGDCNGYGEFTHGCHDYECKECDGTGEVHDVECQNANCRDGGLFQPMRVGAALFDVRYLYRIAKLPNARIRVVGPEAVAAFIFDGGEGRVMPCRGL